MIKNKNHNYYIVYADDTHKNKAQYINADDFVNGFERFFDLMEAKARAVIYAKCTGVPFLIEPRNSASIDSNNMVSCYIATPKMNSARQV